MTATQNKSQTKGEALPCRKTVTSLSRAPCQPHLQPKWPFAQDKTVIWEKKTVLLFGLIFPIHLIHSYIHSGGSSGQLRKGLCCHGQQLKQRRFLWLHPLGPLLLLQWKELKGIFFNQGRKQKIRSEWAEDISQRNQWKTAKGHLALRKFLKFKKTKTKTRIFSNPLWNFCCIFSYVLSVLFGIIFKKPYWHLFFF